MIIVFLIGVSVSFGADDLNLSETTRQGESVRLSVKDYGDILASFNDAVDDAELRRLLDRLETQIEVGDIEGAEATRQEIIGFVEKNPKATPYGLDEILKNSLLAGVEDGGGVDVDLQSLSESIQPVGDLGEGSAERAAKMQELARLLSEENPGLEKSLMDMANLINLGRDEDARSLYGEIDRELLRALIQMDPELMAKAFDQLGGSIGGIGRVTPPAKAPEASAPSDLIPNVGNLASPVSGAPMPFAGLPVVNLTSPYLFLFMIVLPLLVLPLFAFQRRLQVYVPRVASSVGRMIRPVEEGREPSDARERVFHHFRRLVRIMGVRGVAKADYETHREFAGKCSGRVEEDAVKEVSGLYEWARFTDFGVSNEEAERCARLVDTVEKAGV